ncbi:MAG: TetR/AcrR family transcriptional regulator [Rhodospirillales bacterium]
MPTNQELRRAIRRQGIVEAAATVFAEQGIQAATLEQIGAKVGLSKASLYYYVDSKEALVAEVLKGVLDDIDARAQESCGSEADPLERLRCRAKAHVETAFLTPAGRLIVANLDALVSNKAAASLLRHHEEPARKLLQEAKAQGLTGDIDITCAVKLLYGALNNIPRWYEPRSGPLDPVIERTWALFLGGVRA